MGTAASESVRRVVSQLVCRHVDWNLQDNGPVAERVGKEWARYHVILEENIIM